jgi:2-iminobutanoate/2-iminopropanoate deaminase
VRKSVDDIIIRYTLKAATKEGDRERSADTDDGEGAPYGCRGRDNRVPHFSENRHQDSPDKCLAIRLMRGSPREQTRTMAMNYKTAVSSPLVPQAIGPYSQAIKVNSTIYVSGQIPIDKEAKNVVGTDIATQTRQCLNNIRAILEATGAALSHIVKTTVYLKSLNDFKEMNAAYGEFFPVEPPARACVEVSRLPGNVLVEIDCIAVTPPAGKAIDQSSLL